MLSASIRTSRAPSRAQNVTGLRSTRGSANHQNHRLWAGNAASAEDAAIAEKAKLCAACHGENGVPINKQTQVIWGQNEGYFYLQLRDFKRGTRKNPLMEPIAAQFEKKDMYALAAYFTKKKWPDLGQPSAPGPSLPRPTLRRGQLAAAAVTSIIFRATAPQRGLQDSGRNICSSRCWGSGTNRAATIQACPIS